MADPVPPDPTQMGLAQEALDLLRKAGATVDEVANCISLTGKEAGSYLTTLIGKLKGYFSKQPTASTASAAKKGALILLALLFFAGTAEACHRGKRGQAQQQPAVSYSYYQSSSVTVAPGGCAATGCAQAAQQQATPVYYYQVAPGSCASGSCAPSGGLFRRR